MKRAAAFICLFLVFMAGSSQTIRRVNNIAGVTGVNVYTTPQAAHDAAAANDILVIEPSATSYPSLTLTKPLKIYGNGYFLATNAELKADKGSSTLTGVFFDTGSDGSIISGVSIGSGGFQVYGVSNITIQRCYTTTYSRIHNSNLANTTNTNVSNIVFMQNCLDPNNPSVGLEATLTPTYTASNVLVTNNILTYISAANAGVQNWVIRNNTITVNSVSGGVANSTFENNLFTNGGGLFPLVNTTAAYCVAAGSAFSGGVGNQNNYNVTADRVAAGTGISTDETYQLIPTSALKTAGSGGGEVGAFGGVAPYVISGIPAIPSVVNMINSGTGSNSVPLQITVSVKSNN